MAGPLQKKLCSYIINIYITVNNVLLPEQKVQRKTSNKSQCNVRVIYKYRNHDQLSLHLFIFVDNTEL